MGNEPINKNVENGNEFSEMINQYRFIVMLHSLRDIPYEENNFYDNQFQLEFNFLDNKVSFNLNLQFI